MVIQENTKSRAACTELGARVEANMGATADLARKVETGMTKLSQEVAEIRETATTLTDKVDKLEKRVTVVETRPPPPACE